MRTGQGSCAECGVRDPQTSATLSRLVFIRRSHHTPLCASTRPLIAPRAAVFRSGDRLTREARRRGPRYTCHVRPFVIAASLMTMSCMFLVSSETYGDHCKIAGEDTPCGRCLRARCQTKLDNCCRDDACVSTLPILEACAQHTGAACDDFAARKGNAGPEGVVAACAATLCGAVCNSFAGTSDTTCAEPTFGRGATCACTSAPGSGNDFECSPKSYADTICCAPESWPAPGVECTCRPLSCYGTPEGCSCRLVDTPPDRSRCEAPPCCVSDLDPEQCACRANCYENERRVSSCSTTDGSAVRCAKGQKRVDACSARHP